MILDNWTNPALDRLKTKPLIAIDPPNVPTGDLDAILAAAAAYLEQQAEKKMRAKETTRGNEQ